MAKRLLPGSDGKYDAKGLWEQVAAPDLKPGDLVLVEAGELIPSATVRSSRASPRSTNPRSPVNPHRSSAKAAATGRP